MTIKRRTIKRTLSGKKLWFRVKRDSYVYVYNKPECRASSLVASINIEFLFDKDGNWFEEIE